MRQTLYMLIILLSGVCAAFPWQVEAAENNADLPSDSEALREIFTQAAQYSQEYYDRLRSKFDATAASYIFQLKRHDIYADFIASLQDNLLKKIAQEEWVHRESEAMIGSGKKFVSSVERRRREEVRREQTRRRIDRERQREVGADIDDVQ